jgi:hypothetical protein
MANWLDKYEQGGLVLKKKTKDNYGKKPNVNDVKVSAGPGFEGDGYTAQNWKSPAWGGQFQMGGSMPGAVGFTYARVAGSAPANGKYTKKTKASAQNGQEMKFYQEGLDFKPKSISKNGSVIKDDRGQLAYPGEITEIGSNDITMQGVNYPVLGVSDTGDTQMMYPDQDYKFDGEKVTEFPIAQDGRSLSKELKKEAEERLERMKKPKATVSQYTPKKGEAERLDREKLQRIEDEGKLLNKFARSKASGNLQDAIEAALIMEGGMAAGKFVGKGAKAAGKYLTEETALKNAYKLNPYAFKPTEGMMYRGLGKEGMEDALASGFFRAKENVEPYMVGNFNLSKKFTKTYYTPYFNTADRYGQGYVAEVPRTASTWGKRYANSDWSQIAQQSIPITKGKILKKDWLKGYKEVPKPKLDKAAQQSMLSDVMGIYFTPEVVPDVFAKYRGLPGHKTLDSPATTRSK